MLVNDAVKEMTLLSNEILSALFLKRKVFINLISFQRLFDEVIKQSSLLIVICRRRFAVLESIQPLFRKGTHREDLSNNEIDISVLVSGEA